MGVEKILEFIRRGEEIKDEEFDDLRFVINPTYPLFNQWINEIKIYAERALKTHPLYKDIISTHFHQKNKLADLDKMLGILKALSRDEAIFSNKNESLPQKDYSIVSFEDMLSEDIMSCQKYLDDPQDEAYGRRIYLRITSRYDSVIKNFGKGLYSYFAEQSFYDPDISISTINHNLSILLEKLITYKALNHNKGQRRASKIMLENRRVFIVHGHDSGAKQEVARFIERIGLEAIILHEQASNGKTIIEKFEKNADVGYAIVLYTPCDQGRANEEEILKNRARQNVVFEHGYLIGKLGRERVCALVKGTIETPGDITGVVYIQMDNNGAWRSELIKEMKSVGYNIDANKII